eukprot:1694252-Pyramimonas_sp.AAC.1
MPLPVCETSAAARGSSHPANIFSREQHRTIIQHFGLLASATAQEACNAARAGAGGLERAPLNAGPPLPDGGDENRTAYLAEGSIYA